eukprot:763369-Hanusia_phi.AAC.3
MILTRDPPAEFRTEIPFTKDFRLQAGVMKARPEGQRTERLEQGCRRNPTPEDTVKDREIYHIRSQTSTSSKYGDSFSADLKTTE